jgi:aminopeptidase N
MKPYIPILIVVIFYSSCDITTKNLLDTGIPLEMAEYRKEQVADVVYNLSFEIPLEKETLITSRLALDVKIKDLSQPLYLDFNTSPELILKLIVNGDTLLPDHRQEHLIIAPNKLQIGKNKISVDFLARDLSLNRNEEFLYTLLVPDRASTLFPCFDQPDIKANYNLTVTAPNNWEVLSGAKEIEQISKGAFTEHRFGQTEKMSTYLFSFVAGQFDEVIQNPGAFDMRLLFRETNLDKRAASIDEIFKLHQQSIDFLEEYTGYPFPFQKLDFAAIPGFQYGGMEHVGAIQYRESTLFLDSSATESRKLGRGKLIAHETAHMWFGDLVTMRWFNDVWMKEVFANFMADKIANPAFPEINHDLQFITNHYPSAFSEDRTKGTNPIRQQLNNLKNAGTMYGRIIYNKAPIMMRQLEATMGEGIFQSGMQEYIKTYENDNADWNELISILDDKTDLDMKQWSEVWVNQSGRPLIEGQITYGELGQISSFEITQKAEDGSDKLWPQSFDLGMLYADSLVQMPVNITGKKVTLEQAIGLPKPDAVIYNYDGFGYGVFPLDKKVLTLIPELKDEVARGYAYINLYENVLNGETSTQQALNIFFKGLKLENNELIVRLITNQTRNLFWKFLTTENRKEIQPQLEGLLFQKLNEDLPSNIKKTIFNLYRDIAYSNGGKNLLYQIWNGEHEIEELILNTDDLAEVAMKLVIYKHEQELKILEETSKSFQNPDKKQRFLFLTSSLVNDEAMRSDFMEYLRDPSHREKESWVLTALNNIHHPLRHESSIKLLPMCLELLEEIQLTGDIFFPKRWLVNTVGNYSSQEAFEIVENFITANSDFNPVLKNKLLQAGDDLYRIQGINQNETGKLLKE